MHRGALQRALWVGKGRWGEEKGEAVLAVLSY